MGSSSPIFEGKHKKIFELPAPSSLSHYLEAFVFLYIPGGCSFRMPVVVWDFWTINQYDLEDCDWKTRNTPRPRKFDII